MTEKKPLFRYIDEFIFKQIDLLKNSQPYQDLLRQMTTLTDIQLKVVNQAASLILVAVPLIFLIIIFAINLHFNSELEMKRDVLNEINSFTSAQKQLEALGKNIIAGNGLTRRGDFNNQVLGSINTAGGERSSIRVLNFESTPKEGIVSSLGVIKFTGLSTEVLTAFLSDLVDRNRFRVSNILIKKNLKDKTVNGQVELQHYGRAQEEKK